uniref:Uncharacterized protein n=1 Tax=Arundo donax TaxID=35708 RepID=A0A0A9CHN6_ARUDO
MMRSIRFQRIPVGKSFNFWVWYCIWHVLFFFCKNMFKVFLVEPLSAVRRRWDPLLTRVASVIVIELYYAEFNCLIFFILWFRKEYLRSQLYIS